MRASGPQPHDPTGFPSATPRGNSVLTHTSALRPATQGWVIGGVVERQREAEAPADATGGIGVLTPASLELAWFSMMFSVPVREWYNAVSNARWGCTAPSSPRWWRVDHNSWKVV